MKLSTILDIKLFTSHSGYYALKFIFDIYVYPLYRKKIQIKFHFNILFLLYYIILGKFLCLFLIIKLQIKTYLGNKYEQKQSYNI